MRGFVPKASTERCMRAKLNAKPSRTRIQEKILFSHLVCGLHGRQEILLRKIPCGYGQLHKGDPHFPRPG